MRVFKPLRLGFIHRVFDHKKKHLMVATVLYSAPFDRPRAPVSETEMWKMASTDLGRFGVLDHWMFKPQAEAVVTGSCFTGERAKGSDYVRFQVGPEDRRLIDKRLYVFGDRRFTLLGPSEPDTFGRMPLDYAHAFGGPKFGPNPVGKGVESTIDPDSGVESHALPNIEDPKHLITSKSDRPQPASLAPWDLTWPHHFEKKMGTYDKDWVKKNGFALADDMDFSLFNVAAPDQRVKGFFEGNEDIRVEHMHPDKRVVETTLPGYKGRCFIRFSPGHDPTRRLVEVPLNLDTIHVFPHRERVIAFFRGVVEIHTSDATDVEMALAALEDTSSERRSVEHYESVIEKRLDKERGALYSLRDRDLMPDTVEVDNAGGLRVGDALDDVLPTEGLVAKNQQRGAEREYERARESLLAQGVDPELIPPAPAPPPPAGPPNMEDLADFVESMRGEQEEAAHRETKARSEADEKLTAFCAEHGIDLDAMKQKAKNDQAGPPKFSADHEIEKLEEVMKLSERTGVEIPGVRERLSDPGLRTSLVEIQQKLFMAYRLSAHYQPAAAEMSAEEAGRARAELTAVILGAPRERRDFTGADLTGLDLSGIDLEGAFLEGAKLVGAKLSRANLRDAVLARADLTDADLSYATLERANLGHAKLTRANLEGADLSNGVLYEADLSGAKLARAKLTRANTLNLRCENADFEGIVAEQLLFFKAKLSGAGFRGARVFQSVFMECEAQGLSAPAADFSQTVFLMSNGDGADFADGVAENLRIVMSSFERASFKNVKMPGSNLRGAKLKSAVFSNANLRRSDFSGADLSDGNLERAIAVESLFMDTNLEGAKLAGANLMLTIMHRAVLRGADVSNANLFCADLTGAVGDDKTDFSGTNVKRALVAGVFNG